jgi:hypothetical protein
MKFILANKYLCITKSKKLYASFNKSGECLWLSKGAKLESAIYSNINIAMKKNCKLNVLLSNIINSNEIEDSNEECRETFSITSGFSPQLQKFYQSCQSSLQKNRNQIFIQNSSPFLQNQITNARVSSFNTRLSINSKSSKNKLARKCYQFRKTPQYRECMNKHYKCFKFRKNIANFKNCRQRLLKN